MAAHASASSLPSSGDPESPTPLASRSPSDPVALGLRVLIISLSVLFGALLFAYFVARTGRLGHFVTSGTGVESLEIPIWFWFSTFVILVSSVALYGARCAAAVNQPRWAWRGLLTTTILGYLFLGLQIPGFADLIAQHRAMVGQHVFVYGIVLLIAALHATHVIGGLVPLTRLAVRASRVPHAAVRAITIGHMGTYWHFLAIVWWTMFTLIVLID